MSEIFPGIIYVAIFLAVVYAVMRVVARFTAARYASAVGPLLPLINGTFSTDGDIYGRLSGTYLGCKVKAVMIPGVSERSTYSTADSEIRYNAFEVVALDVAGAHDWKVRFGQMNLGGVFSGSESWSVSCADAVTLQRLEASGIVAALEAFAGSGVRHFPTVIYSVSAQTLTHRDNVSPHLAPVPQHFQKQLDLVLKLVQMNADVNSSA